MFNDYARFLRDYSSNEMATSRYGIIVFIFLFCMMVYATVMYWNLNRNTRKVLKSLWAVIFVFGLVLGVKENMNIVNYFRPVKDEAHLIRILNADLKRKYPMEEEGKTYFSASNIEKLVDRNNDRKIVNHYYYKITKVNSKNIKDVLAKFDETGYACLSTYIETIGLGDIDALNKKIVEENKKAKEKARKEATKNSPAKVVVEGKGVKVKDINEKSITKTPTKDESKGSQTKDTKGKDTEDKEKKENVESTEKSNKKASEVKEQ